MPHKPGHKGRKSMARGGAKKRKSMARGGATRSRRR